MVGAGADAANGKGDQFALGLEECGTLTSGSGLSGGADEQGAFQAQMWGEQGPRLC